MKNKARKPKPITLSPQGAWPLTTRMGGICGKEKRGGFSFDTTDQWPKNYAGSFAFVFTREDTRRLRDHLNEVIAYWDGRPTAASANAAGGAK